MKVLTATACVAALAGLAGCASNIVHEGKYAQDEGWRKGEVVEIGPASSITRHSFRDCRPASVSGENDTPYAVVVFLRNGHQYARITKLPGDGQLRVGDKVYVNIENCEAALPKRSS